MIQDDIAKVLRSHLGSGYNGWVDLDDLSSEILLSYLRNGHLETYSPAHLKRYAVRTARRLLARVRTSPCDEGLPLVRATVPPPDVTAQLNEALVGMPEKVRRIALLRHAGFTWTEVGEEMGCGRMVAYNWWNKWATA